MANERANSGYPASRTRAPRLRHRNWRLARHLADRRRTWPLLSLGDDRFVLSDTVGVSKAFRQARPLNRKRRRALYRGASLRPTCRLGHRCRIDCAGGRLSAAGARPLSGRQPRLLHALFLLLSPSAEEPRLGAERCLVPVLVFEGIRP